jgi:hypothetical protein
MRVKLLWRDGAMIGYQVGCYEAQIYGYPARYEMGRTEQEAIDKLVQSYSLNKSSIVVTERVNYPKDKHADTV